MNIELSKGRVAIVDKSDSALISDFKWSIRQGLYVASWIKGKRIYLHRHIMGAKHGQMVDHKDGNQLNNRRSNLRFCTPSQNVINSKVRSNNTSGYRGVDATRLRWRARIGVNGHRILLGIFDQIEDAATAYDQAAKMHFGEFA